MGMYLIAKLSWESLDDYAWMIGSVACGLGFVIFVHELGHFLVAKWCGVKCEKFYIGFDVPIKILGFALPAKLVHFQWGETEYGIGIIPLGGYVKMLGQDDDPRASKQAEELERIRVKKQAAAADSQLAAASDQTARGQELKAGTAAEGMVTGQTVEQADQGYVLDPRSFPAKSVPQRIAIISAGVIMNLIFAVIFATFAFRSGVTFTPCEVGGLVAGGPAYVHGIEPKSRIVQVGKKEARTHFLRFEWDLANGVNMVDDGEELPIVLILPNGEERHLVILPDTIQTEDGPRRMLGISPAQTNKVGVVLPGSSAAPPKPTTQEDASTTNGESSENGLVRGDAILAINGQPVRDGYEVQAILARHPDEPLTMSIEREDKSSGEKKKITMDIVVQPNPLKGIGVVMKAGPVVAIQPGSPAQQAGVQIGDHLESVAGQAVGDPLKLPVLLRPLYGQETEIVVRRSNTDGNSESVALKITPRVPESLDWTFSYNSPMSSAALGLAWEVTNEVEQVAAGSPAAQAGIQPGDKLAAFNVESTEPPRGLARLIRALTGWMQTEKHIAIDSRNYSWPHVVEIMQVINDKAILSLKVQRKDAADFVVPLNPVPEDVMIPERGFVLASKSETYHAQSWGEAVLLGAGRTYEDAMRVGSFLQKLVTGKIAVSNVGGPLTIMAVAGSEASAGTSRLLIFLTFLSANLAVVNFLPIPALDGGHFMFLLWEGASGKPVNERVQVALTLAGVACLLGLMIFVFSLDINRLFF